MKIIKLEPSLHEKIWGGNHLNTEFNISIPSETVGEAWVISAHPNGPSVISSPQKYKGWTLTKLYDECPNLFGRSENSSSYQNNDFPLLVKILDANQNLSVQVHPDDNFAWKHAEEPGKTECWYIISAETDAEIILGHNAKSKDEFLMYIREERWDELLRKVKVKAGDFFYVPSGTIHGIGSGIRILETQQNSDTTYRVFDYNRIGNDGIPRQLHLEEALSVTKIPHYDETPKPIVTNFDGGKSSLLIEEKYFTVWHWSIKTALSLTLSTNQYYLLTIIDGGGELKLISNNQIDEDFINVSKGEAFIIPVGNSELHLNGEMEIIASIANR